VLLPNTTVTGFVAEGGAIAKVITNRGEIRTPVVVDAAGAWARVVAGLANVRLGAIPTRHQLVITQPIPGVEPHQPIARVIDSNVYIRPADGGLMLGGYESNPLQFEMANLPADFGINDLPLDLSVIQHLAGLVLDQFPIFRKITVKEHRAGLPTMTADGEHILGPLPGLRGFYTASGCCVGGLSIAPIMGEMLAEWIVSGKPPIDLSPLSPSRSAVQTTVEDALREDCRRQYACHYWPKQSRTQE
jgi:glycine/D-amino acid oxidase-like deaminating enzyme